MTFSEEYIQTLERIYIIAENGETDKIKTDFSIPKMFGAWSSIFWALPELDKFRNLTFNQLKNLVQSLIKSHIEYSKTTNQALRTETIDWIGGIFKIKAGLEPESGKIYAENWIKELFKNPELEYNP